MVPTTDNEFEIPISQNTFTHLDNDDDDDDVIELPPANSDEVVSPPDDIVGPHDRSAKPLGNVWSKKKKIAVGLATAATFVAAISIGIVYGKNRSSAANNGVVSASMMTLDKCLELDKYSEYRAYAFEGTPTPTPTTYEPTTYEPTESEDTPAASDDDVFPIQYDDQLYLSNDGNGRRKLLTGHEKSLRLSKSMKEDKIGRGVNPASRGRRLVCDDIVYEAYGTASHSSKSTKSSTKSSNLVALPPYSSTYVDTRTRGYVFQAPLSFKITGLRVPNERNQALQNVQVILMDSPIPSFPSSSTVDLSTGFYVNGAQAGQNITTSISVPAGKFVGILGATSSGSNTMYNSYGAGCFASDIGGIPVTLNRLLTQQSIANAPTLSVSVEGCSSIARVELFYQLGRSSKSSKSAAKSSSSGPSSSSEDVDNAVLENVEEEEEMLMSFNGVPPSDRVV